MEEHRFGPVGRWTPDRFTDPANLLYYPVVATLVRMLPAEVFGTIWQRMAFVNALLGAVVLALTYAMALRLFRSRGTALVACLAQLAMGFFLLLSTINEDIMPGYLWFVAAVACVVLPRRLGAVAVVLAAQCVALAWLFHSSLQLPAIGALVVGIAAWAGTVQQAAWRIGLFCVALVPLPLVSARVFELPWVAAFWSGKGVGTGWGGFSANKIVFLWGGVAQSVAGGQNLSSLADVIAYPLVVWMTLTTVVTAAFFAVWLWAGWRHRQSPEWRVAVSVLVAVFILGEGMNLYIQPQDPQMQIQPMTWFPFAVAAVFGLFGTFAGLRAVLTQGMLVVAAALLLVGNLRAHEGTRHSDSAALASIRATEALAAPERTVFVLHGFEEMSTWLTLTWGRGMVWPNEETPEPVRRGRQFNVIYVASEATVFPDRPASESAENIVRLVDRAMEEGFDVVAGDIWAAPEDAWVNAFASVSGPEKPRAIHAALKERFSATTIGLVPGWGHLHRIVRKEP